VLDSQIATRFARALFVALASMNEKVKISDVLMPELMAKFGDRGLRPGSAPKLIATFPARCDELGDLEILDDGNEVTIYLGDVTHGHFNPYDDATTSEGAAKWITSEVIEFLDELFADRVVFWAKSNGSGGWQQRFTGHIPGTIPKDARVFIWSRRLR
jgi:hypothetical protein